MARGLIGKVLSGAAQVAVPAAQDIVRQRFERERQSALQKFQTQQTQQAQAFTAEQNAANRQQDQAQFDATMTQRKNEFDTGAGIQTEQLALDKKKTEATLAAAAAALESANIDLKQKKQIQDLYNKVVADDTPDDQRAKIMDRLDSLLGKNAESFSAITAYGEPDDFGNQQKSTGILNRRTGKVEPFTAGNAATDDPLQKIMAANPGKSREWAQAYLQHLNSQK